MTLDSYRKVGRRCIVSGRVQGVYYRASAQQRALQAGIVGYARNLHDGSVEVLACGEQSAVLEFIDWLWIGPSAAKVVGVTVEVVEPESIVWPRGFRTS
jgi:acylphosphatase